MFRFSKGGLSRMLAVPFLDIPNVSHLKPHDIYGAGASIHGCFKHAIVGVVHVYMGNPQNSCTRGHCVLLDI